MIRRMDILYHGYTQTDALASPALHLTDARRTSRARVPPSLAIGLRGCCAGSVMGLGVLLTALAWTTSASADYGEVRAAARATGYEGIDAFERGDFADAADKLGRAFDVVKVPTLGLWHARALVKCDNLVEASEVYEETIQLNVVSGRIREQKQAQAEAVEELAELQPRIPTLTLVTKGSTEEVTLTIDDAEFPVEVLGMARPTNPGRHSIKARRDGRELEWEITLVEGEHRSSRIDVSFLHAPKDAPAPPVRPRRRLKPAPTVTSLPPLRPPPDGGRHYGWIVAGVGAAATAAGVVTGLLAGAKKEQLDSSGYCADNRCSGAVGGLRANYNSLRDISTVSFIIGAMGLGAGSMVLLTTAKTKDKNHASASVGLGTVKIEGTF